MTRAYNKQNTCHHKKCNREVCEFGVQSLHINIVFYIKWLTKCKSEKTFLFFLAFWIQLNEFTQWEK